ncbi:peptidase S8/S53 domain-containing protein [Gaertneriomyces semiglobifer]|nr:peptidase S8/S53 domain-containing protein [Gaertneriomyces semiglobifer]
MSIVLFLLSCLFCSRLGVLCARAPSPPAQFALHLVHATASVDYTPSEAEAYAEQYGLQFLGGVGLLPGVFLFEENAENKPDNESDDDYVQQKLERRQEIEEAWLEDQDVKWFDRQKTKERKSRGGDDVASFSYEHDTRNTLLELEFSDPYWPRQWHLFNDGANGLMAGNDINVMPVWSRGINGSGIVVSVIDDGIEYTHADLKDNWHAEASYDFVSRTMEPLPGDDRSNHGTRCAGTIAASINDVCGVGVAYGAKVAGERLIGVMSDAQEAQALNHFSHGIDIYSASWGPADDGKTLDGPGPLAARALELGTQEGRNGLGSIYVWASGNGGRDGDNCNFDGFAGSVYTITIGAVGSNGMLPYYSELCATQLAAAFSGGRGPDIATTDIKGNCTLAHSGTSAAAPLAAGVIALMLQVRPDLSWRDVQHLIVHAAKITEPRDESWIFNGAGLHFSHKYGFGVMDADLLVTAAETHRLLPSPQIVVGKTSYKTIEILPRQKLGDATIEELTIDTEDVEGMQFLEHVEVTLRIRHPSRKVLTISLISPSGTESILASQRFKDDSEDGFNPWTFMTVVNWGERPTGTWTLKIQDGRLGTYDPHTGEKFPTGDLLSWSLLLHGTCGEEDTIVDPTQIQGGGHTCSVAAGIARRKRRVYLLIAAGLGTGVVISMACILWRWKRRAAGGLGWMQVNAANESAELRGDIESPVYGGVPDLDFIAANAGKQNRWLLPDVKRSEPIEMESLKSVRVEGEKYNEGMSDESDTDEENERTSTLQRIVTETRSLLSSPRLSRAKKQHAPRASLTSLKRSQSSDMLGGKPTQSSSGVARQFTNIAESVGSMSSGSMLKRSTSLEVLRHVD